MRTLADRQITRGVMAGLVLTIAFLTLALCGHWDQRAARQQALAKQCRLLLAGLQTNLVSAAEAENSAVLAMNDAAVQAYADQARLAARSVERGARELDGLLRASGYADEAELLRRFDSAFAELQRINHDVLDLAVRNTNVKATRLAFGPAAAAIDALDAALARLPDNEESIQRPAGRARIAAWRLLARLPPHIAEASDANMDALEAQMAADDREIRQALDALATLPAAAHRADLQSAVDSYRRFGDLRAQIIRLSRENTNVRSLALSLGDKSRALRVCRATLDALQQALEHAFAARTVREPARPR